MGTKVPEKSDGIVTIMTKTAPKSVGIIGFGPCGAGSARAFQEEGGYDITIFEKRPSSGGLWNYTTQTDAGLIPVPSENPDHDPIPLWNEQEQKYIYASPVYDALDTNIPKDIMNFARVPFDDQLPLFPHRTDVLKYLQNYSAPFEKYVQFNRKVVDVFRNEDNTKWVVLSRPTGVKETKGGQVALDLPGFEDRTDEFDALVIATGNYELPLIPNREGLAEWNSKYPESVQDVKLYRSPQDYKDVKGKILVLGNSASANDLCFQIVESLDNVKVWKLIRSENNMPAGSSPKIIEVADVKRFDPETKLVEFVDGTKLEDVDKVIFATGYLRSFPFFKLLNKSKFPIITDGIRVRGLYKHLILYNFPNLAVVGLGRYFLPTRSSEIQAAYLAKLWGGKIPQPLKETMAKWESDRVLVKGDGRNFHDLLFPDDVHYNNELNAEIEAVEGGFVPFKWNKEQISLRGFIKNIKEAYIKHKSETGKLVKDYHELVDLGYLETYMMSDDELKKHGFYLEGEELKGYTE